MMFYIIERKVGESKQIIVSDFKHDIEMFEFLIKEFGEVNLEDFRIKSYHDSYNYLHSLEEGRDVV